MTVFIFHNLLDGSFIDNVSSFFLSFFKRVSAISEYNALLRMDYYGINK